MSAIVFASIAALIVMGVSLIGVITTYYTVRDWMAHNLHFLVSLSAGLFVIVTFGLLQEASTALPLQGILFWTLLGFGVMYTISTFLPESHHHHTDDECNSLEPGPHAWRILAADAIHNIGDGIILLPAFLVSVPLGVSVTIGILIHEAIQEISEFFILKRAGLTTRQALLQNFLVSSTILIGVVISIFLSTIAGIESIVLCVAAGAFIFVIFKDLLPHSIGKASKNEIVSHLIWFVFGAVLMITINFISPHVHADHDGHDHHGHEHHDHAEYSHDDHEH